jgi:DDE superfamily endonuclease
MKIDNLKKISDEQFRRVIGVKRINPAIQVLTDTGYLGLGKIHLNTLVPKKKSKKKPLTKLDKINNREISKNRVLNENVIGMIKRFKIVADRYRNRRRRFGLRFNLISGIYIILS